MHGGNKVTQTEADPDERNVDELAFQIELIDVKLAEAAINPVQ